MRGQACTAPPGPHTSRQHAVASGVSTFYFQTINRPAEKRACPGVQAPASPCSLRNCSADHTQAPYKPAKPLKSPSWQPEPGKHMKSAFPSPAGTAAQLRSCSGRRRLACCSPCLTDSLTQPHHGSRAIPGPAWMLLAPCSQLRGGASRVPELPPRVRLRTVACFQAAPGWSLLPLGQEVLLRIGVTFLWLAAPQQHLQVGVGAQLLQGFRAIPWGQRDQLQISSGLPGGPM